MMRSAVLKSASRASSLGLAGLLGFCLCFSGCFWKAAQVNLTLAGQSDMNGGGYPVVVCVYQLKNDTGFSQVPLEVFWKKDGQAAFQNDVVSRQEKTVRPGEPETIPLKISKETKMIGVAGDFRRPDGNLWRKIYPISKKRTTITVRVGAGGLEVTD